MKWSSIIECNVLQPYQVEEVCKTLLIGKKDVATIARSYGINAHAINRIYNIIIAYYSKGNKSNRDKDAVCFQGWTNRYYDKESDILKELELNYDNVVLTGEELEIFNKL